MKPLKKEPIPSAYAFPIITDDDGSDALTIGSDLHHDEMFDDCSVSEVTINGRSWSRGP